MEEKGQNCGRGLWVATVDVDVIQLPESGLPTCLEPGVSVSRSALEHAVNAKSSAEMGKAAREAALAVQR